MIGTKSSETRVTSPRDAVSRHVARPHLGHQENAIALTSDHAANKFLGTPITVYFRRVDQCLPERKAGARRFFLSGLRMPSLREIPGALTQRRDDGAVGEFNCPCWACAVERRRFPVGVSPTRQPLQPEASGAVMEVTKWLKPLVSVSRYTVTARVCRP